jgi:RNA polymerase sigma-70 factor (ECF subfamily)
MLSQKNENPALFLRLYSKYEPLVRAYVRNGLHNHDESLEVMQEASIIAWQKFSELENPEENFGKWMCVIARYEILKFRRDKARKPLILDNDVVETILEEGINGFSESHSLLGHLEECLKTLSEFNRKLVKLPYQKNNSFVELAKQINKTPAALYKRASRLRLSLADCMQQKLLSNQ